MSENTFLQLMSSLKSNKQILRKIMKNESHADAKKPKLDIEEDAAIDANEAPLTDEFEGEEEEEDDESDDEAESSGESDDEDETDSADDSEDENNQTDDPSIVDP